MSFGSRSIVVVLIASGCFASCESTSHDSTASAGPSTRDAAAPTPPPVHSEPAPRGGGPPPPVPPPADNTDPADAGPPPEEPERPCDLPVEKTGFVGDQTIEFDGQKPIYQLYVADRYDGHTRFPVVFVFHGDGMSGAEIRSWLSLEWQFGGRAIFVYPNGLGGGWDTFTPAPTNLHYAYIDAIFADLKSKLCVDKKRVFGWGISRGAYFVNHLGCFRGNLFRGIISNSGGGPSSDNPNDLDENFQFKCSTQPVAAVIIHSNTDQTVPFEAGENSREHWRIANHCKSTSKRFGPDPCVMYDGCDRPVVWCQLWNRPHGLWWSTMPLTYDFVSLFDPDASPDASVP